MTSKERIEEILELISSALANRGHEEERGNYNRACTTDEIKKDIEAMAEGEAKKKLKALFALMLTQPSYPTNDELDEEYDLLFALEKLV